MGTGWGKRKIKASRDSPRQLSDFGRFGLVVRCSEVAQIPEVLDDALGKRGAERSELILRKRVLTPRNQLAIVGGRELAVQLLIQITVGLLSLWGQAVEV